MRNRGKEHSLQLILNNGFFAFPNDREVLKYNEYLVSVPDLVPLNVHYLVVRLIQFRLLHLPIFHASDHFHEADLNLRLLIKFAIIDDSL